MDGRGRGRSTLPGPGVRPALPAVRAAFAAVPHGSAEVGGSEGVASQLVTDGIAVGPDRVQVGVVDVVERGGREAGTRGDDPSEGAETFEHGLTGACDLRAGVDEEALAYLVDPGVGQQQ